MARRGSGRDLASLAALGALGLMMNRRSKETSAPVESQMPVSVAQGPSEMLAGPGSMTAAPDMSGDTGDFLSRRLKINPETGEAYYTDNLSPMAALPKSAGTTRAAPISDGAFRSIRSDMQNAGGARSRGRGGAEAGEEAAYNAARQASRMVSKGGSGGGRGPSLGEQAAYEASKAGAFRGVRSDMPSPRLGGMRRPGTNVNYENEETSDMGMKRGGKVKKMASGGIASASKRADGIATKGKTRGKIY